MVLNAGAPPGLLQPLLHLLVGRLVDQLLHDSGSVVVHRRRLARMRRHQSRAHVLVEVLANLLVADLDAGPEAHIDEAQQRQLPHQPRLQILFADAVLRQRAPVRSIVPEARLLLCQRRFRLGRRGWQVPAGFQFAAH